jgi:hypothetical protein
MIYYIDSGTISSLQINLILIQHYKLKGESLENVESVMHQRILKRDHLLRGYASTLQHGLAGIAKQRSWNSIMIRRIKSSILYLLLSLDAV